MIDRCAIAMVVGVLASCSTRAVHSDPHSPTVLTELAADFSAARAQPLGSRPAPPYVDLERLIGLNVSSIQAALGAPDSREPGMPLCEATRCWSYTYGPGPAPVPNEVQHDGDISFIVVTTGGPFLLVLGVSGDRVASAHWLGQR
jgi:hypothetical protein